MMNNLILRTRSEMLGRLAASTRLHTHHRALQAISSAPHCYQSDASTTKTMAAAGAMVAGLILGVELTTSRSRMEPDGEHVFVNWSASHECRPQAFHVPETLEQVEEIVKKYHKEKKKLRCMGAGVSPNGLGFSSSTNDKSKSNEDIITMALFDRILHVDQEKAQVTVQAGMIVGELLDKLRDYDLTMENVASIRDQQIAGITQAGCHGTGAKIRPIDDQVIEMEIITPAKGRMTLSKTQNAELFDLAKCGLGALGIVTKIKLQCVKKHVLIEKTQLMTLQEVKQNHLKWLNEFQHLRYMWIPYTDGVVVVQCRPATPQDDLNHFPPVQFDLDTRLEAPRRLYVKKAKQYQHHIDPEYKTWNFTKLRDKLIEFNPLDKQHIIEVNASEKEFWKFSQGYRIALSDDIVGFDCGGQQLVQEVSFPIKKPMIDIEFIEKLMEKIDQENIPAHSPIEQRWTSRSTSLMSPASSNDPNDIFSWVGVILYLPTPIESIRQQITQRFHEFYAMYKDFMAPYGAFEHWAKIEFPTKDKEEINKMRQRLSKRYPLEKFKKARDENDPHHILSNHIVDTILSE
jgi:L-galactono-1,4-lactone dehydrogenase